MKYLTKKKKEQIAFYAQAGFSLTKIAKLLKISYNSAKRHQNYHPLLEKVSKEFCTMVLEMHKQGYPITTEEGQEILIRYRCFKN